MKYTSKIFFNKAKLPLKMWIRMSLLLFTFSGIVMKGNAMEPKYDVTKSINKTFKVSRLGDLNVDNKYGNINIETWDKDEVSFEIDIKVSASTKSKAEEAIDRISITFSNTSKEVSAVTEIESTNSSGFWSWMSGGSGQSFKIHYNIKCPKSMKLGLSNKYGNITIPDWSGLAVINLKYGNLTSMNMSAQTKLFLSYGSFDMKQNKDLYAVIKYSNGKVSTCDVAEVLLSYSDLKMIEVSQIRSENKYSKISIDLLTSSGMFSGNYNNYKISEANSMEVTGSYSDVSVDKINSSFGSVQSYGGVNIGSVGSNAKSIKFDGKYTGLTISNMRNYNLIFKGKYSTPSLPAAFDYKVKDKEGNSFECEGAEGNGRTNVQVITSYGGVKIR